MELKAQETVKSFLRDFSTLSTAFDWYQKLPPSLQHKVKINLTRLQSAIEKTELNWAGDTYTEEAFKNIAVKVFHKRASVCSIPCPSQEYVVKVFKTSLKPETRMQMRIIGSKGTTLVRQPEALLSFDVVCELHQSSREEAVASCEMMDFKLL